MKQSYCTSCGTEFDNISKPYQDTQYCEVCMGEQFKLDALRAEFQRLVLRWKVNREVSDSDFEDFFLIDVKGDSYPQTLEELEAL